MIAATVSVLQLGVAWPYVAWGLPAAMALATVWTYFDLGRRVAALHLRSGEAALMSVRDVLRNRRPDWEPLLDVRLTYDAIHVSAGWAAVSLDRADWPDVDALEDALRAARHGRDPFSQSTSSSTHA